MNLRPDSVSPTFVSYAQNFEDVVLWRALKSVTDGRYVDVGAADPVIDSVTAAFYGRGWCGINVEPVPAFANALRAARPRDTTVERGVGSAPGVATLQVFPGTGLSTFATTPPTADVGHDTESFELEVEVSTLDSVLEEAGYDGLPIHFLKVDVEGFEMEVLLGTNLSRWKPWVVVVEATAPRSTEQTHGAWEHLVLRAGYRFCLFDGLNRFYVHDEHRDLAPLLSYPVSAFDQPFRLLRDFDLQVTGDRMTIEIDRLVGEVGRFASATDQIRLAADQERAAADQERAAADQERAAADQERAAAIEYRQRAEDELAFVAQQAANLEAEIEAIHRTLSWRVTKPLRAVRSRRSRPSVLASPPQLIDIEESSATTIDAARAEHDRKCTMAFLARVGQVVQLLGRAQDRQGTQSPEAELKRALEESSESDLTKAWLGLVVATGEYPDEETVRHEARRLQRVGAADFVEHLYTLFASSLSQGRARDVSLEVLQHSVVIDVTHTVQHDLQTGIQRVVRETCSRWLAYPDAHAVWWDYSANVIRLLGETGIDRIRNWRDHMPTASGTETRIQTIDDAPSSIIVPWKSILLLPELTSEPARTAGYRALVCAGVLRGISMIGYDLIPVTAAETVTAGMSQVFSLYLSMVKRSSRLSAISETTGNDFRAFGQALSSQGLTGPLVKAILLPPSPAPVTVTDLARMRKSLSLGKQPLVLVVGSHEPRKNHLTVLDAAERLWSSGVRFDLLFIGGSGWGTNLFDTEVGRLLGIRRPIRVLKRASETELWTAYRLASFSVFPSLLEGYGLPIVESLASGTPVITTGYGSMAEVAADGGALLVDPYDVAGLADAMRSLLEDDRLLAQLTDQARGRKFPEWDQYAKDVWRFLVDEEWSTVG